MSTRSTQIAHGVFSGTGTSTVYTVPDGKVLLLKSAAVSVSSGAYTELDWRIKFADGSGPAFIGVHTGSFAVRSYVADMWWHVLEAGDQLVLQEAHSSAGSLAFIVSGALLDIV